MTAATSLIQSAYREGNLIAVGASPTSAEQTEALLLLNNFVRGIYGYEMGENLSDWEAPSIQRTASQPTTYPQWPLNDAYPQGDAFSPFNGSTGFAPFPPKNRRIVWGGVTMTIYFPDKPQDGSRMAFVQGSGAGDTGAPGAILTLDGNGRQTQDPADKNFKNTITLTNPAVANQWLYRSDLGQWLLVADLILTDQCQFPSDFDDFFITALAIRLAPRYNKVVASETAKTGLDALKRLKARYRQAGITVYGSENFPATFQSFVSGRPWW